MPEFLGLQPDQGFWNRAVPMGRNEEHARARLWDEMRRVDNRRSEVVIRIGQRRCNRSEVLPPVRRQTSKHVFQDDRPWSPAMFNEAPHQFPERPECAGPRPRVIVLATETAIASREREVLARKRRPYEVDRRGWQIRQCKAGDVTKFDIIGAPVRSIGRYLLVVDVVGERAAPQIPEARARHAPAGKEFAERKLTHAADSFALKAWAHDTRSQRALLTGGAFFCGR